MDVSQTTQAKSDQLNAVDIMGIEPVITITEVRVTNTDQPVSVYYHGCNNRPWKPSLGMRRMLVAGWGKESDNWLGKSVQLVFNPDVKWAGKAVGGIQIKAMSDIKKGGLVGTLAMNRQKREPFKVVYLDMTRPAYPQAQFEEALPAMTKMMEEGKSIEWIVARCQQTGDLTPEQLQALQDSAPLHIDDAHE